MSVMAHEAAAAKAVSGNRIHKHLRAEMSVLLFAGRTETVPGELAAVRLEALESQVYGQTRTHRTQPGRELVRGRGFTLGGFDSPHF